METFLALLPFIISALGSVTASVAGNAINTSATKKVNESNLAYSQGMTEAQWARDDTSLQRQVEDAKLAGLSPLNVTGAMNSSSPLNYMAQAPQMDLSSLIGAFSSFDNIGNTLNERYKEEQSNERLDKQLHYTMEQLEKTIQKDKDLQQSQFAQDTLLLGKQLTYQYNLLNEQSTSHKQDLESDRLIELSKQNQELYSQVSASIGMSPRIEYYTSADLKKYTEAMNSFMLKYNNWANDFMKVSENYITTGESESDQASMGSNVVKTGVQFSESQSSSRSYDLSDARMRELYDKYLSTAIFPVLIDDKQWTDRRYEYKE